MNKFIAPFVKNVITTFSLSTIAMLAHSQPMLNGSITNCMLAANCSNTVANSMLSITLPDMNMTSVSTALSDCDTTTYMPDLDGATISITQDSVNTTYTLTYELDPNTCPDSSRYSPSLTCSGNSNDDANEEFSLLPMITEDTCSAMEIDNGMRTYTVSWSESGCLNEMGVRVTLENKSGESEPVVVESGKGSITITTDKTDLSYATITPENNLDGDAAAVVMCTNMEDDAAQKPGGAIHSVAIFNPGQSMNFTAPTGSRLSIANMLVQTNSVFRAFSDKGLELYHPNDTARFTELTDVKDQSMLWTSGTEKAQRPLLGSGQPMNGNMNVGPDPIGTVRLDSNPYGVLPIETARIHIRKIPDTRDQFELTFTVTGASIPTNANCSTMEATYAPGICVVHSGSGNPLFTRGAKDYEDGLKELAEDGDPVPLETVLKARVSAGGAPAAQLSIIATLAMSLLYMIF